MLTFVSIASFDTQGSDNILSENVRALVLEIGYIWGSMADLLSTHTKASRQDVFQNPLKATGHTQ